MDAATAAELGLPGEQVSEARPNTQAPTEGKQEANVQSPRRTLSSRIYDATVLTVFVTIELIWFVLLGYGLYSLL